jgi:tRNA(adenine34) deaminase
VLASALVHAVGSTARATVETDDLVFMGHALALAREAAAREEVPIGALLVRGARVLGSAHNRPITLSDPTAHAEILALRQAARRESNYRLPGTTLYVTVEPCLMCVGALMHARVQRVVYGCAEPKLGALGSVYRVGTDGQGTHRLEVQGGVGAEEARGLLQEFFRLRRGA